jgi:hypothetical protein
MHPIHREKTPKAELLLGFQGSKGKLWLTQEVWLAFPVPREPKGMDCVIDGYMLSSALSVTTLRSMGFTAYSCSTEETPPIIWLVSRRDVMGGA